MEKFKQLNRSMIEKMHVLENKTVVAWTILLGICIFAYTNFFDNDGYFLIATGKEIVENGIPKFNPFFLEKGYQIVVQQWLWDVCLYQIQQWFGNYGLYLEYYIFSCCDDCIISDCKKQRQRRTVDSGYFFSFYMLWFY